MSTNSLAVSSTFVNSTRPLASTELPQNAYVTALASTSTHYAAAASLPSSSIHLFDKAAPTTLVRSLSGHTGGISALVSVNALANSGESLLSCGKDGEVKSWDERSGKTAIQSECTLVAICSLKNSMTDASSRLIYSEN